MITKKHILISIIFLMSLSLPAQSRYKYKVEKVAEGIYVLEPDISDYRWVTANIVVIINEADVFIIDSGLLPSAAEEAIKEIKKLTNKPVKYLLNTHWHGDHWQGNEVFAKSFPDLKIIASEKNKAAIERNGMVWVKTFYLRYLNQMLSEMEETLKNEKEGKTKNLDEEEKNKMEQAIPEMKNDIEEFKTLKPVVPNTTFSNKLLINAGNRKIELHYLGIGNTIGDAIVYLPKEKILIPGDLVVYPSPYESGAFSPEWIETSKKLQHDFKYEKLIPGHGEVQQDTIYLSYLNSLFKEIVKEMDAAYRAGKSKLDEMQAAVTYKTVTDELNKSESFIQYTSKLDKAFISAAIKSSLQSLIIGKMQGK